ncbi:tetratricopeptide repeat protein [Clostridium sp.]|uniref:tetratricopeptide repeat protein n=1 Tax=Clostridium sp. TaxID=1506 RepID=UPI0039F596D8
MREALEVYSKAISLEKNKVDAYIGKALTYVDLEDYDNAFITIKRAYEIDPNDEWCKCHYTIIKNLIKHKKCKENNKGIVIPFKYNP